MLKPSTAGQLAIRYKSISWLNLAGTAPSLRAIQRFTNPDRRPADRWPAAVCRYLPPSCCRGRATGRTGCHDRRSGACRAAGWRVHRRNPLNRKRCTHRLCGAGRLAETALGRCNSDAPAQVALRTGARWPFVQGPGEAEKRRRRAKIRPRRRSMRRCRRGGQRWKIRSEGEVGNGCERRERGGAGAEDREPDDEPAHGDSPRMRGACSGPALRECARTVTFHRRAGALRATTPACGFRVSRRRRTAGDRSAHRRRPRQGAPGGCRAPRSRRPPRRRCGRH